MMMMMICQKKDDAENEEEEGGCFFSIYTEAECSIWCWSQSSSLFLFLFFFFCLLYLRTTRKRCRLIIRWPVVVDLVEARTTLKEDHQLEEIMFTCEWGGGRRSVVTNVAISTVLVPDGMANSLYFHVLPPPLMEYGGKYIQWGVNLGGGWE